MNIFLLFTLAALAKCSLNCGLLLTLHHSILIANIKESKSA